MEITYSINDLRSLSIAEGQTLRIRAGNGATIHCVSGQIWLTQQGVLDDFFLPSGTSYSSSSDGLILIKAWKDPSLISVESGSRSKEFRVGPVAIESREKLYLRARRMRAHAIAVVMVNAKRALAKGWQRLVRGSQA